MSARQRNVLIIVENLPVPFDRRVWQEATTLYEAGYGVSVICPRGRGYTKSHEVIDGVAIYRHPLPFQAERWYGYLLEYGVATFFQFLLAFRVYFTRGFSVIQACNPPDTIFLVGGFFKLAFGTSFIFDHHDLSPELYEAKTGRRGGLLHRILLYLERLTYRTADVSIATNESYRTVAIARGGMHPSDVFVVRSGPDLNKLPKRPANPALKRGRRFLVAYVGIMGAQDGLDVLLHAAAHLVHTQGRSDTQFVLVGGGTELQRMQALSRTLGLDDYVTFTGLQPHGSDVLLDVLNTADVGASPDPPNPMNDHSTMNKTLEYMALGTPVVQFDLTEGRASAGDAALYVQGSDPAAFAEAIAQLLDDEALRTRMGAIGRERIETLFSWAHQAPVLLRAYDEAFAAASRVQPAMRRDA